MSNFISGDIVIYNGENKYLTRGKKYVIHDVIGPKYIRFVCVLDDDNFKSYVGEEEFTLLFRSKSL